MVSGQTVFTVNDIDYTITGETTVTYSKFLAEELPNSSYTIPSTVSYNSKVYTVTSLGEGALANRLQLVDINIPNTIKSIENGAFNNCRALTSVVIPGSVTTIGDNAFNGCSALTSATIPNSVTSIGGKAFSATAITSIVIPNSVTSIGIDAFKSCSELTSVTISSSLISLERGVFWDCKKLSSVTIPNSVTLIGDYAFYNCIALSSVNIPGSVISIGTYAFANCSALSSVSIPNSVTVIKSAAFNNCTGLTAIRCAILTPLSITSSVFQGVNKSACSLEVPPASVNIYKAALQWKDFFSITGNATLHTDTFASQKSVLYPNPFSNELFLELKDGNTAKVEVSDVSGRVLLHKTTAAATTQLDTGNLAPGVYLVKISSENNTSVKKMIKK